MTKAHQQQKTSLTASTSQGGLVGVKLEQSVWLGALPPPEALQHFEQICPGAAEKIIQQSVAQTNHRIEIEKIVLTSQLKNADRGQYLGFAIGVLGLCLGTWCILAGHDIAGGSLAGGPIIGLAIAFVTGKRQQKKNLSDKRRPMQAVANAKSQ